MYTFATKNHEVTIRRRTPDTNMETIDAPELDKVFAEQIGKQDRARKERENLAHDEACVWQERFYATLCSKVPPAIVENPLRARDCHMDPVLYHGDRGYQMRCLPPGMGRGFIKIVPSSCIGVRRRHYRFDPVKSMDPVMCLWLLLQKFGDEIIFRAFLGAIRRDDRRDRVDAVCLKYGLPLSGAIFVEAEAPPGESAPFLHVDGATVAIHPDRVEVVQHAEALTPWSKMVLARPDAHAILVEIANALNI